MRITDRMIINHSISYLSRARQRLGDAQTTVVTGRRLLRSSDDPADVERAMTLASELRMVEKQSTNLRTSRDWLGGTDQALSDFKDILIEARNLALGAANDTNSEQERNAIAAQVYGLLENALSVANSQQAGSYLFSGHQLHTPPFAIQGDTIVYLGDNATIQHPVEPGQTMAVNVTGVAGRSGGLFSALTQLQELMQAIDANDTAGIRSFLDEIKAPDDDIDAAQSIVGARMQRIGRTQERLQQRQTDLKHLYSQLVDADMAQVIAEMSAEERAYEMSLAATARVLPRSLLDFLR